MAPAAPCDPCHINSKVISSNLNSLHAQKCPLFPAPGSSQTESWSVIASEASLRTQNPIRKIMDGLSPNPSNPKKLISLGQGDPTVYGHIKACQVMEEAMEEAVRGGKANGYMHSLGFTEARKALADFHSKPFGYTLDPDSNIILTAGCNQAIDLCLHALCNPGDNVLIPRPGFPLYENFLSFMGVGARHYDLLPDSGWQVDLGQVEALRDSRTAAMIVCNPGNPSGSVFSRKHLEEILKIAEKLHLPIIADEVYGGITFRGTESVPLASLGGPVPIFTVSSLSKRFLVPGWRLGWILITDRAGILEKGRVVEGLRKMMQFAPNPCSIVQAALSRILKGAPPEFFADLNDGLEKSAEFCCTRIQQIPGISCPSPPLGSMFVMVKIDLPSFRGISSEIEWCSKLLHEESVVVIPGSAFGAPNYVRCVFATPNTILMEAWNRIESFCKRHLTTGLSIA